MAIITANAGKMRAVCGVLECAESLKWLGTLIQQISELEEWDAILLQELSVEDELSDMDELEALLWRPQN